jgi:hypothetical protein
MDKDWKFTRELRELSRIEFSGKSFAAIGEIRG